MPVRGTMSDLIALVRTMIFDPSGAGQFFTDQQIQDRLDSSRSDARYLLLDIAPSIVNTASTNNQPVVIFADYYANVGWWETDVILQGLGPNNAAWTVLTPTSSDYITGHFTFGNNVFTSGTAPGQLPPVWITGKCYDCNLASAELLEFWGAALAGAYDVTVDGQNLRRSQLMLAKLTMAQHYRAQAKPKRVKMTRDDVRPEVSSREVRLLDSDDVYRR